MVNGYERINFILSVPTWYSIDGLLVHTNVLSSTLRLRRCLDLFSCLAIGTLWDTISRSNDRHNVSRDFQRFLIYGFSFTRVSYGIDLEFIQLFSLSSVYILFLKIAVFNGELSSTRCRTQLSSQKSVSMCITSSFIHLDTSVWTSIWGWKMSDRSTLIFIYSSRVWNYFS